jgi:hypothetical protein
MTDKQRAFELMTAQDLRDLQIMPPDNVHPPYQFYELPCGPYTEYWDVIGVREVQAPRAVLEFRLFHLEIELIEEGWGHENEADWPFFDTFHDANGYLLLSVEEYVAAIAFFAGFLNDLKSREEAAHPHFRWVDWDELAPLRVHPIAPNQVSRYYRYEPDAGIAASPDDVSIVRVVGFNGQHPPNQASGLAFMSFARQRLDDPMFKPRDEWGLGCMRFNQAALRDLVVLLGLFTYERERLRAQP